MGSTTSTQYVRITIIDALSNIVMVKKDYLLWSRMVMGRGGGVIMLGVTIAKF